MRLFKFGIVITGIGASALLLIAFLGSSSQQLNEPTSFIAENQSKKEYLDTIQDTQSPDDHSLTKMNVFNAMLNSIDFYSNAEGQFVTTFVDDEETLVSYKTDLATKTSYQSISNNKLDIEQYSDNTQVTLYNNKERTFEKSFLAVPLEDAKEIKETCNILSYHPTKNSARIVTDSEGGKRYYYRFDSTRTGIASMSLFSQEIIFSFLSEKDLWEITETTRYLDRDCILIQGKSDSYQNEKLGIDHFNMLVDIDTGILLKFEGFTKDNVLKDYIITKDIRIDVQSNISNIVKNANVMDKYAGYKNISRFDYN